MVSEEIKDKEEKLSSKDFPQNTLGHRFPNFQSFYKALTPSLGFVVLKIITKVEEDPKGILTTFIARVFYFKFRNREYVGEEREFVDEFLAELSAIIAEIRRKETEIRKGQISDKGGKTSSGDTQNYQVLSKELTDKRIQQGATSTFDQKGTSATINYKGTDYAPLGRIINSLNKALKIYHEENEEEYSKLPDTSNRKPRVAIRVKHGENLLKAYQKEIKRGGDFKLITKDEFMARIRGERAGFVKVVGGEKPSQLIIGLMGDPGLGKTYICQAIGKALGTGYYRISLNGKNSSSIIYGSPIDNPGAEMGGIVKAISENKSQFPVVFFDEIEKAGKEAKDAIAEPTDITGNKEFKDVLYDFITPCDNLIFFCALNYLEELQDFIRDRFAMIEVEPPSYQQRIKILRALLMASLKKFEEPFNGIWHKTWEEIYNILNQEALLKRALTKTMSIRGAKSNIAKDNDVGDKRRGRLPCPRGEEKQKNGTSDKAHRPSCKCFMNNLDRVPEHTPLEIKLAGKLIYKTNAARFAELKIIRKENSFHIEEN
ncbi:14261_t:CDS:2 [Funneliformis geosporum]|uniref:17832_t:CDS:1 n=1 Tax=Funneliformis geosporum TaxID=1117311 RepID=A0A9W4SAB5_9GLOM|nr:14261_t:CDS:2 [Funneliformis geosporum]CAI2162566.1 17832_t:CDS:2 [Funneliformis geosporum]